MFLMMLAAVAAPMPTAIVTCKFERMPPMVMRYFWTPAGTTGTVKIGKSKPLDLTVGSQYSSTSYGAQELLFYLRLPSSVTVVEPSGERRTYDGKCDSKPL